jgi:hypothetical protein
LLLKGQIEEGLNVMESSNGANSVIAYGKGRGDCLEPARRAEDVRAVPDSAIGPGLREHPELQDILGEPEWAVLLTPADRRGLTPLFWSHVRPYGEVNLDMDTRLDLAAANFRAPSTGGRRRPAGI